MCDKRRKEIFKLIKELITSQQLNLTLAGISEILRYLSLSPPKNALKYLAGVSYSIHLKEEKLNIFTTIKKMVLKDQF